MTFWEWLERLKKALAADPPEETPEERERFILQAEDTGECPHCGTEMEHIGMHERDSSKDLHVCPSCKWNYGEMESWYLVRKQP